MGTNVNVTTWTKNGHTRSAYSPAEAELLAAAGWEQFTDNAGAKKSKVVDENPDSENDDTEDDDADDEDEDDADVAKKSPVKKAAAAKRQPRARR